MTTIDTLMVEQGRTFADEAGIRPVDQPAPLYRLLELTVLRPGRGREQK